MWLWVRLRLRVCLWLWHRLRRGHVVLELRLFMLRPVSAFTHLVLASVGKLSVMLSRMLWGCWSDLSLRLVFLLLLCFSLSLLVLGVSPGGRQICWLFILVHSGPTWLPLWLSRVLELTLFLFMATSFPLWLSWVLELAVFLITATRVSRWLSWVLELTVIFASVLWVLRLSRVLEALITMSLRVLEHLSVLTSLDLTTAPLLFLAPLLFTTLLFPLCLPLFIISVSFEVRLLLIVFELFCLGMEFVRALKSVSCQLLLLFLNVSLSFLLTLQKLLFVFHETELIKSHRSRVELHLLFRHRRWLVSPRPAILVRSLWLKLQAL